jgi:hypothetical protein
VALRIWVDRSLCLSQLPVVFCGNIYAFGLTNRGAVGKMLTCQLRMLNGDGEFATEPGQVFVVGRPWPRVALSQPTSATYATAKLLASFADSRLGRIDSFAAPAQVGSDPIGLPGCSTAPCSINYCCRLNQCVREPVSALLVRERATMMVTRKSYGRRGRLCSTGLTRDSPPY